MNFEATAIEEGSLFVLGDNRVESFDSRAFGTIQQDIVVGKAMMVIWPLNMFGFL